MPNATSPGRRVLSILALAVVAGACAGPGPVTAPPAGEGTGATAAPASPAGLAAVRVTLETAASGLDAPLWVTGAGDGSGRLFIAEQGGRVRVIRDGALLPAPYLDLADRVTSGGERGLLGLAFAPGFGTGGETRLYAHYSGHSGETTVVELRANPGADTVDTSTGRVLLVEPQPYANHNGGWIGFDGSGMLLIGLGDGGSGGDPENRASRLDTILGKMLRLDVLGRPSGALAYGIPSDNPFIGRAGARPEILHYGLRNPFRASLDPATGTLWIGDVGQNLWEEVDVAPADSRGLDFGWRRWEGRHCYDPAVGCDPAGVTMPVAEYGHAAGCSIIGGVVYRGDAIPALRGAYLFSDYCSGTLWAIDAGPDGGPTAGPSSGASAGPSSGASAAADAPRTPVVLLETGRSISSIGTDEAGEVYLTDLGRGELLRLVPGT